MVFAFNDDENKIMEILFFYDAFVLCRLINLAFPFVSVLFSIKIPQVTPWQADAFSVRFTFVCLFIFQSSYN